jgi:hypothetical protein
MVKESEAASLSCKYSNGMGDVVEVTYTALNGGLLTADEVLEAMLDAMAGFSFMQKSIYEAVIEKGYELEKYLKSKNDE